MDFRFSSLTEADAADGVEVRRHRTAACSQPAFSMRCLQRSLACLRCLQPCSCILAMKVPAALQLHRAKRAYNCIGQVLELAYDVRPALYVTAMVTEVGMIPPSSIPVIIREYHDNQQRIDRVLRRRQLVAVGRGTSVAVG